MFTVGDLNDLQAKLAAAEAALAAMETQLTTVRSERDCSDEDREHLRAKLAALEAMQAKDNTKITWLELAVKSALDWLEHADFDYRNGVECGGVDEGEADGWKSHRALVEQLHAAIEGKAYIAYWRDRSIANARIAELEQERDKLQAQLDAMRKWFGDVERDFAAELAAARDQITGQNADIRAMSRTIAELGQERNAARAQAERMAGRCAILSDAVKRHRQVN